jgi:hypothetical protein
LAAIGGQAQLWRADLGRSEQMKQMAVGKAQDLDVAEADPSLDQD